MFVLADWQNAVRNRQIFSRDNSKNAGQCQRFRDVDILDQRVRQVAAQDLAEQHSRQHDVVGKLRLALALRARVDFTKWIADYMVNLTRHVKNPKRTLHVTK